MNTRNSWVGTVGFNINNTSGFWSSDYSGATNTGVWSKLPVWCSVIQDEVSADVCKELCRKKNCSHKKDYLIEGLVANV